MRARGKRSALRARGKERSVACAPETEARARGKEGAARAYLPPKTHPSDSRQSREGKGGEREREERVGSPEIERRAGGACDPESATHVPSASATSAPSTTETPAPSVAVNPAATPAPSATVSRTSPPPPPSPAPLCSYALPSWPLLPLFFLQSSIPLSTAALLFLPCFLYSCSALLLSVICGAM